MSDLRSRIAAAIRNAAHTSGYSYPPGPYLAGIYADAVIKELCLPVESVENWHGKATGFDK